MLVVQVYKAVLDDVREVAVKYLNLDDCGSQASKQQRQQQYRQQFAAEVDIMNACRGHRNICSFIGAWLGEVGR